MLKALIGSRLCIAPLALALQPLTLVKSVAFQLYIYTRKLSIENIYSSLPPTDTIANVIPIERERTSWI